MLSRVADTYICTYTQQAGSTSGQAVGKGIQKGARQIFQGAERQRQKDGAGARCRAARAARERRAQAGGAVRNGFGCVRSRQGYQVDAVAACCSVLQCVAVCCRESAACKQAAQSETASVASEVTKAMK